MEIKLTEKQKIFLEGIVRSSIFIAALKGVAAIVLLYITAPIFLIILACIDLIFFFCEENSISQSALNSLLTMYFFVGCVFNTYIIAKFCGIHKYFSQFKFWKSLIFLIITSALAYYFCNLTSCKFGFYVKENTYAEISIYTIIPSYLTYLFFNFLTKKFPTPFRQIGYFFSNQFYIDMFRKIQKKCKKDWVNAQSFLMLILQNLRFACSFN